MQCPSTLTEDPGVARDRSSWQGAAGHPVRQEQPWGRGNAHYIWGWRPLLVQRNSAGQQCLGGPHSNGWLQSVKEHSSTKTATGLLLRMLGVVVERVSFLQILLSPEPAAHPPACRRNLEHLPVGVHPLHMPLSLGEQGAPVRTVHTRFDLGYLVPRCRHVSALPLFPMPQTPGRDSLGSVSGGVPAGRSLAPPLPLGPQLPTLPTKV